MEKLKKTLWEDYAENRQIVSTLEVGSQECKVFTEEGDKIRNELIKVIQIEEDSRIKEKEIDSNNRNERKRNWITIGTSTLSALGALLIAFKTFRFDEEATFTSTVGRGGFINRIISKIFK